jgi:glutamyl-tRNA reductase
MIRHVIDFTKHKISRFFCLGISYQKADLLTRSLFALDTTAASKVLSLAKEQGLKSLLVLSTCNRTEIYGFAGLETDIYDLMLAGSQGSKDQLLGIGYELRGKEAVEHLFEVASGLDSQITGDYEILGQLKKAVVQSRQFGLMGPVMDRCVNMVIQASKAIKRDTHLSAGTVSVSFAVVEWLRRHPQQQPARIVQIGLGKFGMNVARNIRHYFPQHTLTVINRTEETASNFAVQEGIQWKPYEALREAVAESDVIIVCSQAQGFTILPEFFSNDNAKTIIDLSVPSNVHPDVKEIPCIRFADVDEVSALLQETIRTRQAEIPKARKIINDYINAFHDWLLVHRHAPHLSQFKDRLNHLSDQLCAVPIAEEPAQKRIMEKQIVKTVHFVADNLRKSNDKGCQLISAYNYFLSGCSLQNQELC